MATAPELTPVRLLAVKVSVREPIRPVIFKSVKAAWPPAPVRAVKVPPRVPAPVPIAAVMVVPAWLTGLPTESWIWTAGCWANATPLTAVADGWLATPSFAAGAATMLNAVLVAPARPPADAVRVYPVPAGSMRIPGNVTTPAVADADVAPRRAPPPGFVPMARLTLPVNAVDTLLLASSALTCTVGASATPAVADAGSTENTRCVGPPEVTVTVSVWVTPTPPMVAETIFAPETVEDRAPLATPEASVGEGGSVRVLPLPVAARVTVSPAMGLSNASRAVAVMTEMPPPAAMLAGAALSKE